MVQKIDALVTSNTSGVVLGRPRTGKELWAYLKPRLKTLVVLQSQWGNVHEVYGMQKGSMFEDAPVSTALVFGLDNFHTAPQHNVSFNRCRSASVTQIPRFLVSGI
eukprot:SAG31_NODE_1013_length_10376_cov_9.342220_7_plen_106_part_00